MSGDYISGSDTRWRDLLRMAKAKVVELVALECIPCSEGSNGVHLRNYTTTKNRRTVQGKLELKKYCPRCRVHTRHRETRVK